MRKIVLFLLATTLSASALAQSGRRAKTPPPAQTQPSAQEPPVPETASAARAELTVMPDSLFNRQLQALDKGTFRLADFRGKIIVLNLWATWCGPCRMEVPEYEQVRKKYAGRGVEFIALTTEDPRTATERVKQFVRELNFGFRQGWADPETAVTIMNGRNSIPQTLVIGPDGYIVGHWRGYARGRSGERLREMIERALSESSPAQGLR